MRVLEGQGHDGMQTGVEVVSNGKPVEDVVQAEKVADGP